jgi:hypothetical protein
LTLEFWENDATEEPPDETVSMRVHGRSVDRDLDLDGPNSNEQGQESTRESCHGRIGQIKLKNDLQFGFGFWRSGQDSILATFSESEQLAATNIIEHHIFASWRVRSNVVAVSYAWIGRTLNSNLQHAVLAPGVTLVETEPFLMRHQFDLIYSF